MKSNTPTSARGVRLPNDLWEAIDAAAERIDMTPTELIRRHLAQGFPVPSKVPNSHRRVPQSERVLELPKE